MSTPASTGDAPRLGPASVHRFGPTALATRANAITLARLGLGTPFLVFVARHGDSWAAAGLWVLLGVSDWLDGWLARREGATRSGAFLDPLADKVLVVGAFGALAIDGVFEWLPVGLIALREGYVSVYRSVLGRRGISVPARFSGKVKTNAQLFAVGWALLPTTAGVGWFVEVFLWFTVAITLYSGLELLRQGAAAEAAG